jgi:hypothetical protein
MKIFRNAILILTISIMLASCAAIGTAIDKKNLDVQTKMTNTIFLDPVAPNLRTVFVQVRNSSDKPEFRIEAEVKARISQKGYRIVDNPAKAHYILQANILQVGQVSKSAAEDSFAGGYGDLAAGAVAGGLIGGGGNKSTTGTVAGALVGAGIAFAADHMVKDVSFAVITDLQISERTKKGVNVINKSSNKLAQGNSGSTESNVKEVNNLKKYQTRILSSANQANLKWDEASKVLVQGLTSSISGVF